MANPFVGTNIHGCNSPALGAIHTSYPATFDLLAEKLDKHTHVPGISPNGKGVQIPTNGISDLAITNEKLAVDSVDTDQLALLAVETAAILNANVTVAKQTINRAIGANAPTISDETTTGSIQVPGVSLTVSGTKPVRVELVNGLANTGTVATDPNAGFIHVDPFVFGEGLLYHFTLVRQRGELFEAVAFLEIGTNVSARFPLSMVAFTDPAPAVGLVTYLVFMASDNYLTGAESIWGMINVAALATEM